MKYFVFVLLIPMICLASPAKNSYDYFKNEKQIIDSEGVEYYLRSHALTQNRYIKKNKKKWFKQNIYLRKYYSEGIFLFVEYWIKPNNFMKKYNINQHKMLNILEKQAKNTYCKNLTYLYLMDKQSKIQVNFIYKDYPVYETIMDRNKCAGY